MNPIINGFFTSNATPVCLFKCIFIKFNKYIFIMINLVQVQTMHHKILTKLTK